MDKLIVTAAISGGASPKGNPYLPKTPKEQTIAALECYDAGASIVHIHAMNPVTNEPEQKTAQSLSVNLEAYFRGRTETVVGEFGRALRKLKAAFWPTEEGQR